MENQEGQQEVSQVSELDKIAYIYLAMPFYVIPGKKGGLFEEVAHPDLSQEELYNYAFQLGEKIKPFTSKTGGFPGDFSKYYDFMNSHFGGEEMNKDFNVFHLNGSSLKPAQGFEKFKNLNAQFQKGAMLGQSPIFVEKIESPILSINPLSGIGFFICGLECVSKTENSILEELAQSEFFRNIGWRRNQTMGKNQVAKHKFVFDVEEELSLSLYDLLSCYLNEFSESIQFYQDRASVMYSATSVYEGSKPDVEFCALSYEIIRVPDRNAARFSQDLLEPTIQRVGRNVAFTALNEGALIVESVNQKNSNVKNVANKYFPAFFLALNQREVLLSTMQKIVQLESDKLRSLDAAMFRKMENMRNGLLILQLKQIFYSVSNVHEVEVFFNQLQKVFAVEKMLLENDQSIREMYNLLEVKRNAETLRLEKEHAAAEEKRNAEILRKEKEQAAAEEKRNREILAKEKEQAAAEEIRNREILAKEKEQAAVEEKRANIINTILGAIGCLGLFSFLKDVFPFYTDSAYHPWYRVISIVTPVVVMVYIVRLVFYSKK